MKACVLESINNLVFKETIKPMPKSNEVLVKIKACGICSSDVGRVFKNGTYNYPTILGHEFSGEVVAVGDNAYDNMIGKRVAVFPLLPCFECTSCKEEEFQLCENYKYFGSRNDGGFAEYLAVPIWNLVTFSDKISFESASLCEPTSVAKHAIDKAGDIEGKNIVIVGNGTIGLLAGMWAKVYNANKIFIIGRSKGKVEFAKKIGFSDSITSLDVNVKEYINENTNGQGADIVLEMVGSEQSISESILIAKKGGTIVFVGNPSDDICLKRDVYWKILRNELTVKGSWNSSFSQTKNDWVASIKNMENGVIDPEKLITHKFPLAECEKAFNVLQNPKENAIKVIFKPSEL